MVKAFEVDSRRSFAGSAITKFSPPKENSWLGPISMRFMASFIFNSPVVRRPSGGGQHLLGSKLAANFRKEHFALATLGGIKTAGVPSDPLISPRFAGADTKLGGPVAITPGRRRMLIASRHHSINHGRFQVAQVNEQAIQIFEEI